MPLSNSERQRLFRERRAQQKAAQNPTTPAEVTVEDTEPITQLSRAAGVPRSYPLSVWKRAASALIGGPETSPAERRAGKPTKVQALKAFCASDKDWRKKVSDFVKSDNSEAVRKYAAAQGWNLNTSARAESLVDRMVAVLEKGERLEDHFTAEELSSPAEPDPKHDAMWADYQRYLKESATRPVPSRKCGHPGCTEDFKTDFDGVKRCDEHCQPGALNGPVSAPSDPQSPAAYINSNFGKEPPSTDPRVLALKALADAYTDAPRARGGADFGPTEGGNG